MAKNYRPNQILLCVVCVMLGVTLDRIFLGMNSVKQVTPQLSSSSPALSQEEVPSSQNLRTAIDSEIDRRRRLLGFDPKTVELRMPQPQQLAANPNNVVTNDNNVIMGATPDNNNMNNMHNPEILEWMANHQLSGVTPHYADTAANSYSNTRDVHVGTMCRCPSNQFPVPATMAETGYDTAIVQHPSKATGPQAKHFIVHPPNTNEDFPPILGMPTGLSNGEGCQCLRDHEYAEPSYDMFLEKLNRNCPDDTIQQPKNYEWDTMPDLAVEERLPLFAGVLSFESPLSLNASLHNWRDYRLFQNVGAQEVFVQMNHMSELDEQIINTHNQLLQEQNLRPLLTPMGSPQDNLHPGLTIAKFCRAAEAHPASHPNGENLLLFVEKDWHTGSRMREEGAAIFRSINALVQRGVHYVRFQPPNIPKHNQEKSREKMWNCPSQGYPWLCSTSHQHRWANQPSVIDCKWFLRYLEPFALLDDPIMYGCRKGMQEAGYIDWECALQDGRIAWTNSQWVVAHLAKKPKIWNHHEVDQ